MVKALRSPLSQTGYDRTNFERALELRGLKRGCRDWRAYERGKKIIDALATSSADYDQMIGVLVDFLGL